MYPFQCDYWAKNPTLSIALTNDFVCKTSGKFETCNDSCLVLTISRTRRDFDEFLALHLHSLTLFTVLNDDSRYIHSFYVPYLSHCMLHKYRWSSTVSSGLPVSLNVVLTVLYSWWTPETHRQVKAIKKTLKCIRLNFNKIRGYGPIIDGLNSRQVLISSGLKSRPLLYPSFKIIGNDLSCFLFKVRSTIKTS